MIWKVCLFTPSLEMGGTERVVSILSNCFAQMAEIEVHLILCSDKPIFYSLERKVSVHTPDFDYKSFGRLKFTFLLMRYLRKTVEQIDPNCFVSFGGRYNSFSILALTGMGIPVFISERSRPGLSFGNFLDLLNAIVYRRAAGIIAQTRRAAEVTFKQTHHNKIETIGNPITLMCHRKKKKRNVILNVGRFIKTKNQARLINIFSQLPYLKWELWFVGDGPEMERCQKLSLELGISERVSFLGKQSRMEEYYSQAAVFAFVSDSEGFPNALAEAMTASCVCISYDCVAGPADLIEDGKNGYLIPLYDDTAYIQRLKEITKEDFNLVSIGEAAKQSMTQYSEKSIAEKTLSFIRSHGN